MKITFLCLVVLLSQLLLINCNLWKERKQRNGNKGKTPDAGKQKATSEGESEPAATDQNEKRQRPKGGKRFLQGKFSKKDQTECTWTVTGEDTVNLKVECTNSSASFWCMFAGRPSICTHFKVDEKSYWKQIGRAVRKHKDLCQSLKAVLRSKICKKGPGDAHLTLIRSSLVEGGNIKKEEAAAHEKANADHGETLQKYDQCMEDGGAADREKLAEQYCGKRWGSWCSLLFSVLQDKKC